MGFYALSVDMGAPDYSSLVVGSGIPANALVLNSNFLYRRKAAGIISGTWTLSNWDPVFSGGVLFGPGAPPSDLAQGSLWLEQDVSNNTIKVWLGTATTPTLALDASAPILYGASGSKLAASNYTDGTVWFNTDVAGASMVQGGAWVTLNFGAGSSFYGGIFGTGSDGALVFDGTTTIAGLVPSANTYTMTRGIHATSITINSGVTLKPSGFRIFSQGAVTNAGTISYDGAAGGGNGTPAGLTSGSLLQAQGATGVVGVGVVSSGNGVLGGAGGASGSGSSGAGAAATNLLGSTPQATIVAAMSVPYQILTTIAQFSGNLLAFKGGSGGSAGAGDGTNKGGAGGNGGGVIAIFAGTFVNTGTISAVGGAGGSPPTGNCGGGGGGGGGGVAVYTRSAATMGTITLTGGAGGTAVGTGVNGSAGSTGASLNTILA